MSTVMPFPTTQLSDESLVKRLFDMALSGQDDSEEFLTLDAECQRRLRSTNEAPEVIKSSVARSIA